jgi:hypothetical protein
MLVVVVCVCTQAGSPQRWQPTGYPLRPLISLGGDRARVKILPAGVFS